MFNIIFPIIIFVSLAVIVFIIGKHLPEFVDIKKNNAKEESGSKKNYIKKFAINVLGFLKKSFMWLVEKIIQKTKNFLTLIQSWVVDNKKSTLAKEQKNNKEETVENDKDEFTERNNKQDFFEKIAQKESDISEKRSSSKAVQEQEEISNKSDFSEKKPSFFSSFKSSLKDKILEKKKRKINKVFQETEDSENQFSDGIVGIHEKPQGEVLREERLINEVVEVKKNRVANLSVDDEIGVDRHILEKKLIGKIAKNPKDKEVYRQLGELYLKMKNFDDSENCYKQILRIAVRDVDAKRKIERIKLLKRSVK